MHYRPTETDSPVDIDCHQLSSIHQGIMTAAPDTIATADIPSNAPRPSHLRGVRATFAAALEVEAACVGCGGP
jgi:hypothetical protein